MASIGLQSSENDMIILVYPATQVFAYFVIVRLQTTWVSLLVLVPHELRNNNFTLSHIIHPHSAFLVQN